MSAFKEAIRELYLDKQAMQDAKFADLDLVYKHVPEDLFYTLLDDLCAKNIPAHFPGFLKKNASVFNIPSKDEILNSLAEVELEIAVTPKGNADSPSDDGKLFVKPFVISKPLSFLLEKFENPDNKKYYFQSQDDNLQYIVDEKHCPIPRQLGINNNTRLFGKQVAANLWIGNKGTVSRLHSDNFDNIYIQVSGTKRIHLIPPMYSNELKEKMLAPATYKEDMSLQLDADDRPVLFPTYDPNNATELSQFPQYTIDLHAGDVLFMPALWYHQVSILGDETNISLNYWHEPFDDEYRWSEWNFSRQLAQLLQD